MYDLPDTWDSNNDEMFSVVGFHVPEPLPFHLLESIWDDFDSEAKCESFSKPFEYQIATKKLTKSTIKPMKTIQEIQEQDKQRHDRYTRAKRMEKHARQFGFSSSQEMRNFSLKGGCV